MKIQLLALTLLLATTLQAGTKFSLGYGRDPIDPELWRAAIERMNKEAKDITLFVAGPAVENDLKIWIKESGTFGFETFFECDKNVYKFLDKKGVFSEVHLANIQRYEFIIEKSGEGIDISNSHTLPIAEYIKELDNQSVDTTAVSAPR